MNAFLITLVPLSKLLVNDTAVAREGDYPEIREMIAGI